MINQSHSKTLRAKKNHLNKYLPGKRAQKDIEKSCLIALTGDYPGKTFELKRGEMLIGRTSDNALCLSDQYMSRHHAKIVIDKKSDNVAILDLNSSNGIYVNYSKVTSSKLVNGDKIILGTTILKFLSAYDIEAVVAQELYHASTRDPLTGLFNKRYFFDALTRTLSTFKRYGTINSLCMVDIDLFKKINDMHGHVIGDLTLKHCADVLRDNIRKSDTLCRYGGEEFGIIFTNCSLDKASFICEKTRKTMETSQFNLKSGKIKITISIGVTSFSESDSEPNDIIHRADLKLYEAKKSGRNKVCW